MPQTPEQQQRWDLMFGQTKACAPCGLLDPSFRSLVFKCPKSLLEHCCSFDVFSKDEWACHTSPASVRSYLHRLHGGLGVNALFAEGKISTVCKSKLFALAKEQTTLLSTYSAYSCGMVKALNDEKNELYKKTCDYISNETKLWEIWNKMYIIYDEIYDDFPRLEN